MAYWNVGVALVGAAVSVYNGKQQQKANKAALAQAESAARKQEEAALLSAKTAEEQANAANMKSPDTAAMLSAAMLSGKAGQSGTMLTGPQGVTRDKLNIKKSVLLGA